MNKSFSLIVLSLLLISASCKEEGFKTTETGLQYMMHTKNEGPKPNIKDILQVHMTYYTESDSMIFNSKDMRDTFLLSMEEPSFMGSVEEGMQMMSVGDSITMIVSADSVFEKTIQQPMPEFIRKGSMLKFNIKMYGFESLESYQANLKAKEEKQSNEEVGKINNYISENGITVQANPSGLYFIPVEEGSGTFIQNGDEVTVDYTGKFLDGTVFDTSVDKDVKATFKVGQGQVIPAWDEALLNMKKGSKAKIIVPSSLAYGARGYPGLIPPFSSLVFDMHILDHK